VSTYRCLDGGTVNTTAVALLALALLSGCSSSGSSPARTVGAPSPEDSFVSAAFGDTATSGANYDSEVLLGERVCSDFAGQGAPAELSVDDFRGEVADFTDGQGSKATAVVTDAIDYLCPAYKRVLPG
jgi:hypothetical protein